MFIKHVEVKDFRTHNKSNLEFCNGLNFLIGTNKIGKTSILEAINIVSTSKSHKVKTINKVIKYDRGFSSIDLISDENDFRVVISPNKTKYFLNNNEITKITDFVTKLKVVFYTPEDVYLFTSTPKRKRKFFDSILSQTDKEYLEILIIYNKILKQRNTYLKSEKIDMDYLEMLSNQLINYGKQLIIKRNELVEYINENIKDIYENIFGKNVDEVEVIKLRYKRNITLDNYETTFKKELKKDMDYKVTHIGPHKDDFDFLIDKNSIVEYGSYSQKKIFMFSLKFIMAKYLEINSSKTPILLLDYIFGGLDKTTSNNLLSFLDNKNQVLITTTDLNQINKDILNTYKVFNINEFVEE